MSDTTPIPFRDHHRWEDTDIEGMNRICECGLGETPQNTDGPCAGSPETQRLRHERARLADEKARWEEGLKKADRDELIAQIYIERDRATRAESELRSAEDQIAHVRSVADQAEAARAELQDTLDTIETALQKGRAGAIARGAAAAQ